mgnify:CR=1 FL=1
MKNIVTLRKLTKSNLELLQKTIRIICVVEDYPFSDGEIEVLAHIIAYGDTPKTYELILKSGLIKSKNVYYNMKNKFKKFDFLHKNDKRQYVANEDLVLGTRVGIIITLDNS